MDVIAQQGDRVYLLLVGDDMARVLDLDQGKLFPAYHVHSILARGYWEDFTGNPTDVLALLKQVEIMEDFDPDPQFLRVKVVDIHSNDHLATIECRHGRIVIWENPDPDCMPTLLPGVPEDIYDDISSWMQLVPEQVMIRGRVFSKRDGDEFLYALIHSEPSNIIWFHPVGEAWQEHRQKFEDFSRNLYGEYY